MYSKLFWTCVLDFAKEILVKTYVFKAFRMCLLDFTKEILVETYAF